MINPISPTVAEFCSGVTGGLVGVGTFQVGSSQDWSAFTKIASACGLGALTYIASSYILHNFTAQGRYNRALSIFGQCSSDQLLCQQLRTDREVYQCVATQLFCCEWPLVKANARYIELYNDLVSAHSLLQSSLSESSYDSYLAQEARGLMQKVCFYQRVAQERALLMKKDIIEYDRQLSKYQKHQALVLQQQQLSLQQQQANYTWWDRWDKERRHREKMAYKRNK